MAISVDYSTTPFRVSVPQADLTPVTGTLYELDTKWFWDQLKAWEASETGIVFQDMQSYNAAYSVFGTTYFPKIEVLNSTNSSNTHEYEVFFTPDTQWSVRLSGSNNNIADLQNAILANSSVQVIPNNSAGGQIITAGSGVTEQDKLDIADRVWDTDTSSYTDDTKFGGWVKQLVDWITFYSKD